MKCLLQMALVLFVPIRRARALRGDDRAQVMVLTAVMVFVMMIFAVSTMNTSSLIHSRIRAQNAVDAAADAHALWQARGLNLAQHLNDLHYDWLSIAWAAEFTACTARYGCAALNAIPFVGPALYVACCIATSIVITGVEAGQAIGASLILGLQSVLNFIMPVLGFLTANAIAEANGADPVIGGAIALVENLLGGFGLNLNIAEQIADLPVVDSIFVFPLSPGDAFTLNLKKRGDRAKPGEPAIPPRPSSSPWTMNQTFVDGCRIAGCPTPVICMQPLSIIDNEPGGKCGWRDTFYFGFPSYNTWVVSKMRANILPDLYEKNPWLNPRKRDPRMNINFRRSERFEFEHRGERQVFLSVFENPAFVTLASSQVEGRPVVEKSDGFSASDWAAPKLISVHIHKNKPRPNGTDEDLEDMYIWH